jgi:hypothetical protein
MVTRNHDYIPELRSVIEWHWGPPANVVALNAKSRCLANHCLDDLRPDPVGITMTINDLHIHLWYQHISTRWWLRCQNDSAYERYFHPWAIRDDPMKDHGGNNHKGKGFVNRYHLPLSLSLGVALYRWASFTPTILVIESSWGLGWNGCPISK